MNYTMITSILPMKYPYSASILSTSLASLCWWCSLISILSLRSYVCLQFISVPDSHAFRRTKTFRNQLYYQAGQSQNHYISFNRNPHPIEIIRTNETIHRFKLKHIFILMLLRLQQKGLILTIKNRSSRNFPIDRI